MRDTRENLDKKMDNFTVAVVGTLNKTTKLWEEHDGLVVIPLDYGSNGQGFNLYIGLVLPRKCKLYLDMTE